MVDKTTDEYRNNNLVSGPFRSVSQMQVVQFKPIQDDKFPVVEGLAQKIVFSLNKVAYQNQYRSRLTKLR